MTLSNAVGAAAPSIAQTVMLYLLGLSRQLPRLMRRQSRRAWDPVMVRDLDGMRLGVVGMGAIGSEVARLAGAFDMRTIGLRRTVRGDEPCETWTADRLHELLGWADAVVLTTPLTDETRGMFGPDAFAAMRPGAWFVNVGRGEVVDETALVQALRSGHVAGAGLDVFADRAAARGTPAVDDVERDPHAAFVGRVVASRRARQRVVPRQLRSADERHRAAQPGRVSPDAGRRGRLRYVAAP